jgi:two-component system, cell cycle sensor histidine kinase PleC
MTIPTSAPREPSSPADKTSERRRFAAQSVREARDRLTSSSKTKPAFDYELLRQFAQNRLSGSLVILMLVGSIGFLSSIWTGALTAGTWAAAVLAIHAIIVFNCRAFLAAPPRTIDVRKWR